MTVNGIDISLYGAAQQWNVEPGFSSITNPSEWIANAPLPLLLPGSTGLKKIKVGIVIKGVDRDEIWRNSGRLISNLIQPAEVKLDGFRNTFQLVITNAGQAESSLNRFHKATLELTGYEHGERATNEFSNLLSGSVVKVDNKGTKEAAAVINISYSNAQGYGPAELGGLVRVHETGETKPIRMTINAGYIYTIDGETGLITKKYGASGREESGFYDINEIWGLPTLKPGSNRITYSGAAADIKISHKPLFL